MFGVALIRLLGVVFVVVGWLTWKKEKIALLHEYHYDKVAESDKKAFCKLSGWGVMLIGIGLLITSILLALTDSAWSFVGFGAGFAAGIALLIYAGKRYNSEKGR